MKRAPSQHDQLKSELLRDIVDRLNQKLALLVLRINSSIKREIYLQFEIQFAEYIARDYAKEAFLKFKSYKKK